MIFLILFILSNWNWLSLDSNIPGGDFNDHLRNSIKYSYLLKEKNLRFFIGYPYHHEHVPYPTLVYQITSIFFLIFGRGIDVAVMSQSIFWFILIFSVYSIGSQLWSKEAGLLAGIASLSFPYIVITSQAYLLDLPCASMVALSLLCLIKSDSFKKPGWAIAFFVACALAMLVKWASVFFIVIPFLCYFGKFMKDTYREKKSFWLTLVLLLVLCVLVGVLIWHQNSAGRHLIDRAEVFRIYFKDIGILSVLLLIVILLPFRNKSQKRFVQGAIIFFILVWHFYGMNVTALLTYMQTIKEVSIGEGVYRHTPLVFFRLFTVDFLGIIRSLLLLTGIVWYIFDKDKTWERTIYVIGFVSSVIILFYIHYKDLRYLIPITAFTSVLMTFWISRVKWKILKIPLIVFFLILSFLGFAGWRLHEHLNTPKTVKLSRLRYQEIIPDRPHTNDWKVKEIGEIIERHTSGKGSIIFVFADGCMSEKAHRLTTVSYMMRVGEILYPPHISFDFLGRQGYLREQERYFSFFLVPDRLPDVEVSGGDSFGHTRYHLYDNLLILDFQDKEKRMEGKSTYINILRKRGIEGDIIYREKLELHESKMNVLEMKIDPPIKWNSVTPRGVQRSTSGGAGWN